MAAAVARWKTAMEASTRCAVGALALAYIATPALRAFRVGYLTDFFAPSLAAVLMLRYWSGGRQEVVRELRGIATDWTVTPLRAVVGCADLTVPLLDRVARLLSAALTLPKYAVSYGPLCPILYTRWGDVASEVGFIATRSFAVSTQLSPLAIAVWVACFVAVLRIYVASIELVQHRFWSHGCFEPTSRPVAWLLWLWGAAGSQGGALTWVAIHRRHHRFTDAPGDPHSPHAPPREACAGATPVAHAYPRGCGLAYAHFFWMTDRDNFAFQPQYVGDLYRSMPELLLLELLSGRVGPLWSRGAEEIVFRVATACLAHDPFESWHHPAALRALASDVCFLAFEVMTQGSWAVNSVLHMSAAGHGGAALGRSVDAPWLAHWLGGGHIHRSHHAEPKLATVAAAEQTDFCDHFTRAMERAGLVRRVRRRSTEEEVKKD